MNTKEKHFFRLLCNFKADSFDESALAFATPSVLGHLFFNRMQGIAYHALKKHGLLGKVGREFRNSLSVAYEANLAKNRSFYTCLSQLREVLDPINAPYAMLKGAYLCGKYPEGCRTSNDIDLLVLPQDVTRISEALTKNGFSQGNIRNGVFVPATRTEIISSRMLRGELVPFIKEVNLPGMKHFEVDVNFSLDYKNSAEDALSSMLARRERKHLNGEEIPTLCDADFFIHLCTHLYKEATTLPWVRMCRDMTLYKYADIYLLLDEMNEASVNEVFLRAHALGLEKECAFAVLSTAALFDIKNEHAIQLSALVLNEFPDYLHTVTAPAERKTFVFDEKDISTRFFAEDRAALLKEVKEHV